MCKKLDKIIEETVFNIQDRGCGWKGFTVFLYHKKWVKFSVTHITDEKPRLTKKYKKELVEMALENKRVEDYNYPLYFEREKHDSEYSLNVDCISRIIWDDEKRKNLIAALLSHCEHPDINEVLQRVLDMQSAKEEIRKIEWKKMKRVCCVIGQDDSDQ